MNRRSSIFLLLFFVSGACGLIYQIVWVRLFTPIIGNTVFSVSVVLAVFMAGLALGSRLLGRLIDTRPVPLVKTYAALEAGIGIYNLLLPLMLVLADPVFGALYGSAYDSFALLSLGRLLVSFTLLIVPATLMGGTLPILIRYYTENIETIGLHAGRVYTANTWGAALGTVAAGFLLIPTFGVWAALAFAAVLNLLIAGVSWRLARSADAPSTTGEDSGPALAGPRIVLFAMLLSGFAALANEVAWTRVLSLIVGPTTYAFTLMLTAMIAGLGLGAWLGSKWTARGETTVGGLGWIEIWVGFTSLALVPLFGELPVWIGGLVTRYVESFRAIQAAEFLLFLAIMLVPTALLGMTFPIASKLYARSDSLLGTEVSAVYAFNTAGGILGSLAAGFLLVPAIGTQYTLVLAAALSVLVGVALTLSAEKPVIPRTALAGTVAVLALIPAIWLMPRWDPELMASGAYKYAPHYASNLDLESVLKSGDLLYFREGTTTTVSVKRNGGSTTLAVDGKVDATDSGDMLTQKMLGHLPLLLSDQAGTVVNIGFGSGVTAGAALQHPIEKLDVIEISPEVIEASRFFEHVNHRALEDPRVEVIIGDGRNHLRYTTTVYDVSISEPSNPWMSGMASLFTREFFEEVRERLSEHGIHCQWVHSYNMSTEDLRTIVRSFRSAFPHAALWALNDSDFLLLGSPSPIEVSEAVVRANYERVRSDLEGVYVQDLYSILSMFMIADDDLDRFAGDAVMNTDDFPVLEFRSPQFIYANTTDENLRAVHAVEPRMPTPSFVERVKAAPTAANHRRKGEMLLFAGSYELATDQFQLALELDPKDEEAWSGLIQTGRGRTRDRVTTFVEVMVDDYSEPEVLSAAAEHYMLGQEHRRAVELLERVLENDPGNVEILVQLSDVLASEGSPELAGVLDRLLALEPDDARGLFHLATMRQYQGLYDEAIEIIGRSIEIDPGNMRARNLLAILYSLTFQHDRAGAEFRDVIDADPSDSISLNNYGLFLVERGRHEEALDQFERAIDIDPENVHGFLGVAEALRQSGNPDEAEGWYRKVLTLSPGHPIASTYSPREPN